MTLKLVLPGIVDGTGLPASPPAAHPLRRAGSISILDPSYPALPWADGIPATVPNLAGGEDFAVGVNMPGGVVTRTNKKAFLAAASINATGNETVTFGSAAARDKLVAAISAGHDIGIAEVYRIVREAGPGVAQAVSYRWAGLITTGGSDDVATLRVSSVGGVVGYRRDRIVLEQEGTTRIETGAQAAATVLRGAGAAGTSTAMHVHHNGGAKSKQAARITYLGVIEDRTVSAITGQAFIDSINEWVADEFGAGGRYANDGWPAIPAHPSA